MKIISSVDEYTQVYTRRNTRIYKIKKFVWIFVVGCYILTTLQKFRPRNLVILGLKIATGITSRPNVLPRSCSNCTCDRATSSHVHAVLIKNFKGDSHI